MKTNLKRTLLALIPLGVLILLLALDISIFGADSILGAWSSCGMTQATILSVPTLVYAPFCFFCLLSPLMSFLMGLIGWKIHQKSVKNS